MNEALQEIKRSVATVLALALKALTQPKELSAEDARNLASILEGQAQVLREVAGPEKGERCRVLERNP